jgi:hypothetical protein
MQRKGAISGLLFMGVLIVLGTMGLVYGSWSENLNINGSVQTGEVNVEIESKLVEENGEKGKEIATCLQDAVSTDPTDPKADKVIVKLDNAFPGYSCHFWTNIHNRGTLPVSVTAQLKIDPITAGAIRVERSADNPDLPKGDCENFQLAPGDVEFCDWTVFVLKGAEQDADYEFGVNIFAELINKPGGGIAP